MAAEPDGRLHPFSWLFVLVTQLRQVALPLVFVVAFGRGAWWDILGAASAVGLAVYSLVYSFGFRYRLGPTALVVREGLLNRTERHVPYARIQNVVQRRNPLHRFFGVTELRLESAGGTRPEAVMNVITLAEAARIEELLRGAAAEAAVPQATAEGETLLELPPGELVRLGLVTNRGLVAVGAVFALLSQAGIWELSPGVDPGKAVAAELGPLAARLGTGWSAQAITVGLAMVAFVVALKVLSVGVSLLSFHGFALRRAGERVATERGLLTRHSASARRDKIQRLLLGESWLARRLGRRWLLCEVAAGVVAGNEQKTSRLKWLAPIATPAAVSRVVAEVAPGLDLAALPWTPLHPLAWRRRLNRRLLVLVLVATAATPALGGWALLAVPALVPWLVAAARGWARFAAYACDGRHFAWRSGWLARQWVVARLDHGQALTLASTPFDRRRGMATVELDSAGASPASPRLRVPYLAELEARELVARLRVGAAG